MEDQFLPLSEASFYVLLSLSTGRKHGYAILKDIGALSDGRVNVSTSTLYGALGRMQEQGLIQRVELSSDEPAPGLPRKAYELTELGQRVLKAELSRLQRQVQAGQRRLGLEASL